MTLEAVRPLLYTLDFYQRLHHVEPASTEYEQG
jgi:hypothetical protein